VQFDLGELRRLEALNLVNLIPDPHSDLLIANYAPKAQYSNAWEAHPILLDCRGTILRPNGAVYAKPFRKFFNAGDRPGTTLEELAVMGAPEIAHKRDGSMITLFPDPKTGRVRCATRGSFTSDQASAAEQVWYRKYGDFKPRHFDEQTYIFEYTAPDNRIVVSYAETELTLIGLVSNVSGEEQSYHSLARAAHENGLPCVAQEDDMAILSQEQVNFEGYVLYWPKERVRVKVKLAEYLRIHRIITGVSERTIWEMLRDATPLDAILDGVPDEFHHWITITAAKLRAQYQEREQAALLLLQQMRQLPTRKDQALSLRESPYRAIVFKMLDQRPYDDVIWKELRPAATRPFIEEDA